MASDAELVLAARAGDRAAFADLVGRYRSRARAAAQRLLGDPQEAEDVAQESVLQAYLGLHRLRDPARFGGWLCAIALNLARMRVRSRRALEEAGGGRLVPPATEPSADDLLESAELFVLVHDALSALPAHEREVVLLHYVDGLSSREIAERVGRSPVAVRVRLHRARTRLRDELRALAPIRIEKEDEMVEVEVQDVVTRVLPNGELPNDRLRVVLLKEKEGPRILPIWVGAPEGDALALQLAGEETPRPMTADLAARLVQASGARLEHVAVSRLEEKTFYAVVTISAGERTQELDARPSDAVNLAIRAGVPVFVDGDLLDQSGVVGDLDAKLDEEDSKAFGAPQEGEWTSVSPDLVRSTWPPPPR